MAPFLNGYANGNRQLPSEPASESVRFSDIPSALDIQVSGAYEGEAVEISLEELLDDPTELCTLLENENAEKRVWMIIALAYARQGKVDLAIDILHKGLGSLSRGSVKEKLGPLGLLCWMFLNKSIQPFLHYIWLVVCYTSFAPPCSLPRSLSRPAL